MKSKFFISFMLLLTACSGPTEEHNDLAQCPGPDENELTEVVCLETSQGEFCLRLFPEKDAPQTVANFRKYVNDGDYNGTFIHRSIPVFVIQGGRYRFDSNLGPLEVPKDPPVVNEFKRSNTRGTVAMAKIDGNPNSATSEWFINLADNSANLDAQNGGFTVFAEIVIGMNVVDSIAQLPVLDLRGFLGDTFESVPMLNYDNEIVATDFVTIMRAYVTERDLTPAPE